MEFETLLKRNKNLTPTPNKEAQNVMDGYPVVGNTSGIRKDEVILSIEGHSVVTPKIRDRDMSPTVVMHAKIIDTKGVVVPRLIFLSTLIRKINLDEPYKGMLNEDAAFKKHTDFTNKGWVEAFTKAAPFQIEDIAETDREIQVPDNAGNPTTVIKVKELTLQRLTPVQAKALITSDENEGSSDDATKNSSQTEGEAPKANRSGK